jgi:hypothetical protein
MKLASAIGLAACAAVACSRSTSPNGIVARDKFDSEGTSQVEIATDDGTTYYGYCTIALREPDDSGVPPAMLGIYAGAASSMKWSAQMVLSVDSVRDGHLLVTLGSPTDGPNTGFIDDQAGPDAQFSQSGEADLRLAPGRAISGAIHTDTKRFSGSISGTCNIECSSNQNDDSTFTTPFCSQFRAWL